MATEATELNDGPGSVEVRVLPRAALIALIGEHDLSTRQLLFDAVDTARQRPRVVVDLAGCTFLDSSILGVLFSAHAQCDRLVVVLPDSGSIVHRIVAFSGVRDVIPVFETLEDAFRNVSEPDRLASAGTATRTGRAS